MQQWFRCQALVLILATAGCTSGPSSSGSTLDRYLSVSRSNQKAEVAGLRYASLREAALSTGARAGLAFRARQINLLVLKYERQLDLVYDFNAMMLDYNVLPPVLIEGRHPLDQNDFDILRVADRAFTIQSQARFVTVPPTWRDYLKLNYNDPEVPDVSLLPRGQAEKEVWDKYVQEGWQVGLSQADVIFTENLGRLKRDYEGMIRYRSLLCQNMVSLPYVAEINLGITGGDSQMAINDRILRITALPEFNINGNEWNPDITPDQR